MQDHTGNICLKLRLFHKDESLEPEFSLCVTHELWSYTVHIFWDIVRSTELPWALWIANVTVKSPEDELSCVCSGSVHCLSSFYSSSPCLHLLSREGKAPSALSPGSPPPPASSSPIIPGCDWSSPWRPPLSYWWWLSSIWWAVGVWWMWSVLAPLQVRLAAAVTHNTWFDFRWINWIWAGCTLSYSWFSHLQKISVLPETRAVRASHFNQFTSWVGFSNSCLIQKINISWEIRTSACA